MAFHDILFAGDGQTGLVAVVSGLSGTADSFTWTVPTSLAKTNQGAIKVKATDTSNNQGEAISGPLTIK